MLKSVCTMRIILVNGEKIFGDPKKFNESETERW